MLFAVESFMDMNERQIALSVLEGLREDLRLNTHQPVQPYRHSSDHPAISIGLAASLSRIQIDSARTIKEAS
jgi:hypothetical protein